jgi:hypothetical protein
MNLQISTPVGAAHRLDSYAKMHEAKTGIHKIEIVVKALPMSSFHVELFRFVASLDVKRMAGFHTAYDADQPFGNLFFFGYLQRDIFFADFIRWQVNHLSPSGFRDSLRGLLDLVRHRQRMFLKVLQLHLDVPQVSKHSHGVSHLPQRPTKSHAVKTIDDTQNSMIVTVQEILHRFSPLRLELERNQQRMN